MATYYNTSELSGGGHDDLSVASSSACRRSSSGLDLSSSGGDAATPTNAPIDVAAARGAGAGGDNGNGALGTLHCTARYDFEKTALVVTINRCHNLPAKDTAAKSR